MIEFMKESDRNCVGVRVSGTLTEADYNQILIPRLEEIFEKQGRLRIVFYMDEEFSGWDLSAAWSDASFGISHRSDFERLAIVGGPEWVHWAINLSRFLMKGEIRIFPRDQLDEAWKWARS